MSERVYGENLRLSYPHLFIPRAVEEGGEPRYSASLVTPANSPFAQELWQAVQKVVASEFGPQPGPMKPVPLYSGNEKYPGDPTYAGMVIIQAAAKTKPHVVDRNIKPIIDPDMVYAGCYVNASISVYAYKRQTGKGIAFGLDGIQFLRDGERLDGRPAVDALFSKVAGAPAPLAQGPGMPRTPGTGTDPFS